eukprot:Skav224049  [mRNA]  locus=scaffold534:123011:133522:- [translate_table: standard]
MVVAKCYHEWQQTFNVCPYGKKWIFDVTFPDAAKARSLNAPHANELVTNEALILLMVAWSYVPMILLIWQVAKLLVIRGTRELCFVCVLGSTFVFNELILKRIISQTRPEISCVSSCGMPSSHSAGGPSAGPPGETGREPRRWNRWLIIDVGLSTKIADPWHGVTKIGD